MRLRLLISLAFVYAGICFTNFAQAQQTRYDPVQARSYMDQANDASKRGDINESIRLAVLATQADPEKSDYFSSTSWFSFQGGYYKEGVQFGERAVFLNPNDWGAHFIVAANAYRSQDLEKARLHYKISLANPNIDNIHVREATDGLRQLSDRDYEINWSLPNKSSEIIVPFVYDTPYQKTLSFSVKGGTYTYKEVGSQKVIAITPTSDNVTYSLKVRVLAHVLKKGDFDDPKITGSSQDYLSPSARINSNDPLFVNLMSRMPHTDTMSRMYAISWWLSHNLKYQLNFEAPSASETIKRGYAECREFSEAATALARNAHIPCRVMWIMIVPDDANDHNLKGHFVVEFYSRDMGWVPLDPQQPWTTGMLTSNYIRICHADPACIWGPYMGMGETPSFTEMRK